MTGNTRKFNRNAEFDGKRWADIMEEDNTSPVVNPANATPAPVPVPLSKEEELLKTKKETIKLFKENLENRAKMFMRLSATCEAIHKDICMIEDFYNGKSYTLSQLENDPEILKKINKCQRASKNVEAQINSVRSCVETIEDSLFELLNGMRKICSAPRLFKGFSELKDKTIVQLREKALDAATEEIQQSQLDEIESSKIDPIYKSFMEDDEIDEKISTRSNQIFKELCETTSIKMLDSDIFWNFIDKTKIVDVIHPQKIEEVPQRREEVPKPLASQIAMAPARPRVETNIKLEWIKINFNITENSSLKPEYIKGSSTMYVKAYKFQTFAQANQFVKSERPVGKILVCQDLPGKVGYVVESFTESNDPNIFFIRNKFGPHMGVGKARVCKFDAKCKKQNCKCYHPSRPGDAYCYSPSESGCPFLYDGDKQVLNDETGRYEPIGTEHLTDEAYDDNIKPMNCQLQNFGVFDNYRKQTVLAMRVMQAFGWYNSVDDSNDEPLISFEEKVN